MGLTPWLAFGKGDTIGGAKGGTGADFDTGGGGGAELRVESVESWSRVGLGHCQLSSATQSCSN